MATIADTLLSVQKEFTLSGFTGQELVNDLTWAKAAAECLAKHMALYPDSKSKVKELQDTISRFDLGLKQVWKQVEELLPMEGIMKIIKVDSLDRQSPNHPDELVVENVSKYWGLKIVKLLNTNDVSDPDWSEFKLVESDYKLGDFKEDRL